MKRVCVYFDHCYIPNAKAYLLNEHAIPEVSKFFESQAEVKSPKFFLPSQNNMDIKSDKEWKSKENKKKTINQFPFK